MKFLVITSSRIGAGVPKPPNPEATFEAAQQWNKARLQDRTLDFVYGFATGRGGVSIVNADCHEELLRIIKSSPVYHFMDYEIRPVCDLDLLWELQIASARAGSANQGAAET